MTHIDDIIGILDEYAFAKRHLTDVVYNAIALGEESGEVLGNIKKWMRDDNTDFPLEITPARRVKIARELGDVLFHWVYACDSLGYRPEEILSALIRKISSRQERGTWQEGH